MTSADLIDELHRLGLTQIGAARLLGVDARTVRRWIAGERSIPGPVDRLLRVAHLPGVREALEREFGTSK